MLQGLVMGGVSEKRIKYGYLYNWYATQGVGGNSVTNSDAWRIPIYGNGSSTNDFAILNTITGGNAKLKHIDSIGSTNSLYWNAPNTGAENNFNFDLKGSGGRQSNGDFLSPKNDMYLMCSDLYSGNVIFAYFDRNGTYYVTSADIKKYGLSIRFIRTATPSELLLANGAYCDKYIGNDGQKYLTVKIGAQVWMAENLAETKYRNGDAIPNVTDNTAWAALTTGARCANDNNESNVFI